MDNYSSQLDLINVFKQLPVPTCILKGQDFIIEFANQKAIEFWGKPVEQVIAKPALVAFPQLVEKGFKAIWQQIYSTGQPFYSQENSIEVRRNGKLETRYITFEYMPLYGDAGEIIGITVTVQDVTEKVLCRKRIQESEIIGSLAMEAADIGTFDLNLATQEFVTSSKVYEIFGFSDTTKFRHADLIRRFHPQDRESFLMAIKNAITTGLLNYEAKIVRYDELVQWIRIYGKIETTNDNVLQRIFGTIMDITPEKKLMGKLEENQERLNIAISAAELGAWELNIKTKEVFYSDRYLKLMGFPVNVRPTHEQLLQKVYVEDKPLREAAIRNALETGALDFEMRIVPYEGSIVWIKVKGKVFFDSDNAPIKMMGTIQDITHQKNAFNNLQQSELLFKTITNVTPVGLWLTNKEGYNTFVNATWIEWTGLPLEKQLGTGWLDKAVDEDKVLFLNSFNNVLSTHEKFSAEFRFLRVDGQIRHALAEGTAYYDINGAFAGYAGSVTDITERKMVEEELEKKVKERTAELKKSQEMNFRMVNEVEDYIIILLNKEGIIENWNKGAEKIKGYTSEEAIGKHFNIFYTAEDLKHNLPEQLIANATAYGRSSNEGWRVKKSGELFWANTVLTTLYNDDKEIIGFSKVTRDLTKQKMAEQLLQEKSVDLEKVNQELEKSNSDLEQFAYVASHDLQEPLRKIQFFIEGLQRTIPLVDETAIFYFDKIKNSTVRMNTLIKDLLDFSRLSQAREQFLPVDLNSVLENVTTDLELVVQQKDAIISIGNLPTIEAIPLQMQQLFYNLLSNALKFSKENEACFITVESEKLSAETVENRYPHLDKNLSFYAIKVSDNGIGFDQQYAEKIFIIFQRLNDFYTYSGTGIGLALCKKIMLNHYGEIFATSEENKGACFHIIIPEKHTVRQL